MSNDSTKLPSRLVAAATWVLEGEYACHECGCIVPVFGLMVVGPFERHGDLLLDDEDASVVLGVMSRSAACLSADVSKCAEAVKSAVETWSYFKGDFGTVASDVFTCKRIGISR